MRRILIDYVRRFRAAKRGGDAQHVDLDSVDLSLDERSEMLITLDGGMTEEETAEALGTARTVRRDWMKAKAWLSQELQDSAG